MDSQHYLLAGLGNPGTKYEKTRHNIGFIFADWFGHRHGALFSSDKHQGLSAALRIAAVRIRVLKPQTFMNRSGRSVAPLMRYFDLDPSNLLVVHDDIDMYPGRVKLVEGGGTGGHNGIRSIVQELGTNEFFRLKIGIGRPGTGGAHADMEVDKYVLANFLPAELEAISERFEEIASGLDYFWGGNVSQAMTRINGLK